MDLFWELLLVDPSNFFILFATCLSISVHSPADRFSNTPLHLAMESGHGSTAVLLLEEGGVDRERLNMNSQAAEDLEGLGGQAQQRVKDYINSRVGPREG